MSDPMEFINTLGKHVQLTHVYTDEQTQRQTTEALFPLSLSEDVLCDDFGNSLRDYLPIVNETDQGKSPMEADIIGTVQISDTLYNLLVS